MYTGPTIITDGLQCYFDADNLKSYNPSSINDPNLLDIGTWIPGYSTPALNYFSLNGSAAENNKYVGLDPFGEKTMIWEANTEGDSSSNGGWDNGRVFNIDPTKTYRFSTWVHRSILGNGNFYLGMYANSSGGTLLSGITRTTGLTGSTNTYFYIEDGTNLDDGWVLIVSHLWPNGSGAGAKHTDTGRYTIAGGKISNVNFVDYIIPDNTAHIYHRSYLYYATTIPTQQRWCYPRIDLCDGTEPTVAELLSGYPNQNQFQIKDLSNNSKFINLGNRLKFENNSFKFISETAKPNFISMDVSGHTSGTTTVEIVFKRLSVASRQTLISFNKNNINSYALFEVGIDANDTNLMIYKGDGSSYSGYSPVFAANGYSSLRYNVCTFVINGSSISTYINGTFILTWVNTQYYDFDKIILGCRYGGSQQLIGNIKSFKFYDRVLSQSEITQNFNATKSRFGL